MKKYGKYEKRSEGVLKKQPKVKGVLLQTYLTSLLCMVLCVTMFFGTSYAWFTSEVQNTGNEIYVGVLDVELEKKNGDAWESLSATVNGVNTVKLYSDAVRWEPGYTSVETVRVVDEGDLAFNYELTFTDGKITGETNAALQDVAKWFDVWVYHDTENTIPSAKSYAEIAAENSGWKKVGTLAEVLGGKSVFEGDMEEADVADKDTVHNYTIALHMNGEQVETAQEEALNALMGQHISLNVKLVASQKSSEADDSGNADGDKQETVTEVTPENLSSIDFSAESNATYLLGGSFTGTHTINLPAGANITIDGSEAEFGEGAVLIINAPQDADSYSNAQNQARVGSYTIKGFKGQGALSFVGYNTTVNITDNTLGFLGLRLANTAANVTGNKIDGQTAAHGMWEGTSEYGVYLAAADYDLVFTGNTVVNSKSHAVGINGRKAEPAWPGNGSNENVAANNSITFTGNTISGYGTGKAALKIWDDTCYAEASISSESELSENAKNLINHVLAAESNNTITKPDGSFIFNFYDLKLDALSN